MLKIMGVRCDAVHFGIKLLALCTYLKILGTALRISVVTFVLFSCQVCSYRL